MNYRALWELTRFEHALMYGFAVLIGAVISGGELHRVPVISGMLTAIFVEMGTFALNDYFDLEVDRKNERYDRPLVRGDLKPEVALYLGIITIPLGILFSAFINIYCFIVALSVALLGIYYDVRMKEFGIAGNLYIAFSMAVPFLFGGLITLSVTKSLLILFLMAFIAGFGREVMKGIMDVEGDALRNVRSVARVMGINSAKKISAFSYLLAVLLSPVPFFLPGAYSRDLLYIIFIIPADALFLKAAFELVKKEGIEFIRKLRKETLYAILLGLIGFLAGSIF
ncbi:MAG: UbiA family prenyltransferase [Archaeoglobi archaeon]|nr:UbiA family prenyltransferase [Candidatus Mnemosynella bozhongmuii]